LSTLLTICDSFEIIINKKEQREDEQDSINILGEIKGGENS